MKKHYFLLVAVMLLLYGCQTAVDSKKTSDSHVLQFNANGTFRIAQFTDIHWNPASENNHRTLENISRVLSEEKPDLVIYTGDIVTKAPCRDGWMDVTRPLVESGIPWAVTLGNHDDENDITREEIFDLLQTLPGFVGEKGPDISGTGNYVLPIQSSSGNTEALIWCFDSHGYPADRSQGKYDWIKFDQINWYRNKSSEFTKTNGEMPVPSLAYFHIPLPEYKIIATQDSTLGLFEEEVCSPDLNSGLFNAFLEMGDVMGMFVGHDHVNNYIGTYMGIAMGYGQVSGADSYGRFPRGARMVELTAGKRNFKTWINTAEGVILPYQYPVPAE